MTYTIKKLGQLAGISTRTLRYYDEIGLLEPAHINASGYRIYTDEQVNKLQQILFYRELGVALENIKDIITAPQFDAVRALAQHRDKLLAKRTQLDLLIGNVEKPIATAEGSMNMSDKEKFEGFKAQLVEANEAKYGSEIRKKYGEAAVKQSNEKVMGMSKAQYDEAAALAETITEKLAQAFATGDPAGSIAQETADLHRRWLLFYWSSYSKEAHAGVAKMYVEDERFTAYYDKAQPGTAAFLRDAILIYTGMQED